ncbi:MAG: hypothetical protein HY567_02000 [Candidatus Kerfeldbacteria bacterium]|nr:hypothetical protein [Candidatus Kerfeldbacteria bacterium]
MTLFQKGIVTVARTSEIDLIGKITAKLVQIPWVEDRDEYRKKLRFELRQNNEWLTLQNIRTTAGVVPPTVKEWISLAEKSAFENEPLTSAIFTNKVFQGLSRNEQIVVQRILAIDDFLSLSSASPEGFELATTVVDENGQRLVFEGGEVRPAADPKSEQLLKQYFTIRRSIVQLRTAHAAADEARYEQQEALLQQTGSDMNKVLPMLKDALVRSDLPRVVTATMVLVRAGAIKDVLKDQAVRDGLVTNLLKPLADRAGVPLATVLAKLNANVDQPVYVGACLRWLLETAFPGNPAEAARVGHQAEQLLGALGNTSLTGLTYFDTRANQFAWTPMRMNPDGMLVWQR